MRKVTGSRKTKTKRIDEEWVMRNYSKWVQQYNEALYRGKVALMDIEAALLEHIKLMEQVKPDMVFGPMYHSQIESNE